MGRERVALVDTSFVGHFQLLGESNCSLLEFILECHGEQREGDAKQIAKIRYCRQEIDKAGIKDHGIGDEEVLSWFASLASSESVTLRKIFSDYADLKLLLRAKRIACQAILLTCDANLLLAAAKYDLPRLCFKAAVAKTHELFGGGIRNSLEFGTDAMEAQGSHPFFHFCHNTKCSQCDPSGSCTAR